MFGILRRIFGGYTSEKLKDVTVKCAFNRFETNTTIGIFSVQGDYKVGGLGNTDASFITKAFGDAISSDSLRAIVIDFSDMRYSWGNAIVSCLQTIQSSGIPFAIVISNKCQNWPGDNNTYNSMDEALNSIRHRIT